MVVCIEVPEDTPRTSDVEYEVALLGPVAARFIAGVTDTEGCDIDTTKYTAAVSMPRRLSRTP